MGLFLKGTMKTDRKVEERKRGRHMAKGRVSDSNPGRPLSAVWHMVACSFQSAKPALPKDKLRAVNFWLFFLSNAPCYTHSLKLNGLNPSFYFTNFLGL